MEEALHQEIENELNRNNEDPGNKECDTSKENSNRETSLNCLYTNIQSLVNKRTELVALLHRNNIHLVFLTETWLTENHAPDEYHLPGYQDPVLHHKDKGGSAIFVKEGLDYIEVQVPEKCNESTWISIKTQDRKSRIYGCIYRSPNSPIINNELVIRNLEWATAKYDEVVITGDFNLPSIAWEDDHATGTYPNQFLQTTSDLDLDQMVTEHTRFRHGQNPSLLDLILTNQPDIMENVEYLAPIGKSDHVSIKFKIKNAFSRKQKPARLRYRKIRSDDFRSILGKQIWDDIFSTQNELKYAYCTFNDVVVNGIVQCTPKSRPRNTPKSPWINHYLMRLAESKRKKWDKYKFHRSDETYQDYKNALNLFNREKNAAVRSYEARLVETKNADPKPYYRYLSSKSPYLDRQYNILNEENVIVSDEKKCGTILNNYLGSVFTKGPSERVVIDQPFTNETMPDLIITQELVKKYLLELNPNKSMGPDEIPAYILKTFADDLSYPISLLFNRSYQEGILPEGLKSANVIPIHKGGDKTLPKNYRPISLTPIITKIFERIYADILTKHLDDHQILSPAQHGFRKKRSTTTNLLQFWDTVTDLADQSTPLSIIYTDLRKAFDSVPHDLLLQKLKAYGIQGKNLEWMRSYLSNRRQRVLINGTPSEYIEVESGVPQGGVLSGILFSLYINDLPNIIQKCHVSLYADDAKIYAAVRNNEDVKLIQKDIDALMEWCRKWRLNMSTEKCFFLHFIPRNSKNSITPIYKMNNEELERRSHAKDLGITISDDLKFHKHTQNICNKTKGEIGRIRRSFVTRSPCFLTNLYKTYVSPHLEFCSTVWNPVYQMDIDRIEKVQNKFTRLLKYSRVMTPAERNSYLNISTHQERREG